MQAAPILDRPFNVDEMADRQIELLVQPANRGRVAFYACTSKAWKIFKQACFCSGLANVVLLSVGAVFEALSRTVIYKNCAYTVMGIYIAFPYVAAGTFLLSATVLSIHAIFRAVYPRQVREVEMNIVARNGR